MIEAISKKKESSEQEYGLASRHRPLGFSEIIFMLETCYMTSYANPIGNVKLPQEKGPSMSQETPDIDGLCEGDKELAEDLKRVLFLNPGRISNSIEDLAELANGMEQKGDKLAARINYETAGRLALMKGDVEAVRRYFSKSAELEVDDYLVNVFKTLASRSQEAVEAAKKYYHLVPLQKLQ